MNIGMFREFLLQPLKKAESSLQRPLKEIESKALKIQGDRFERTISKVKSDETKVEEAGVKAIIDIGEHSSLAEKEGLEIYGFMTRKVKGGPLDNVGHLGNKLMRGAQPTTAGFRELAAQGVKTVINLRAEDNQEADVVKQLGMKSVFLPEPPLDAPSMGQTLEFLKLATDPANGKVYFHCYHGSDRTGTMAAAVRIARDGWTTNQAIAELPKYGFHSAGQQAKLNFIKSFEAQWKALPISEQDAILHRK